MRKIKVKDLKRDWNSIGVQILEVRTKGHIVYKPEGMAFTELCYKGLADLGRSLSVFCGNGGFDHMMYGPAYFELPEDVRKKGRDTLYGARVKVMLARGEDRAFGETRLRW